VVVISVVSVLKEVDVTVVDVVEKSLSVAVVVVTVVSVALIVSVSVPEVAVNSLLVVVLLTTVVVVSRIVSLAYWTMLSNSCSRTDGPCHGLTSLWYSWSRDL